MAAVDEVSRNEIVKSNLRVFLPYIAYCIPATQLLTNLHYYDRGQRKEVFTLSCSRPHEATKMALQILLDLSGDEGQFIALLEALQAAGYPKVVDILSGKFVPNDVYDEHIIQLFAPTVIQQLNPVELLPYLVQYGVIGDEETEHVRAENMNHGAIRASYILLSYIPSRIQDWFKYLLMALIECGYEGLAETLEPDLFAKIMGQRQAEQGEAARQNKQKLSDAASLQEHFLSDAEADVDLTGGKPECVGEAPVDTSHPTSEGKPDSLDFSELLDDAPSDLVEKETVEENEKGVGEEMKQVCDNIETENVMEHMKPLDGVNGKDGSLRYDRTVLLSLRNSPLANIAPEQLLNHPDRAIILSKATKCDAVYGGARPKVSKSMMLIEEETSGSNKNLAKAKHIDDLCKELEDLLKENNSTAPIQCDGMNDLTTMETLYTRTSGMNDLTTMETLHTRTETTEELDYNIITDHDEIDGVIDEDIELREYQKELAKEGVEGENVIIMAPTNSGKTRVSTRIIQEHLRRQRREGKIASVIFLVQDEILAVQQAKSFAEHLPAYRTKVISGTTQRDKKEFLKDFIDKRDILVVTAQVLINSLELGEIANLTRFTMMVFDECHHANKMHPYNQILSKYLDLKIVETVDVTDLPQVVGMTASLGCGGYLEEQLATNHMKQVMANMDAKYLCTIKHNLEELKQYVNPPIEEIIQVKQRTDNGFEVAVEKLIDKIGAFMVSQIEERIPQIKEIICLPHKRGTQQFLQWLSEFKKVVAASDEQTARVLNPCRHHLEVYNTALLIYKDARVKDAKQIIDRYMQGFKLQQEKDETDNYLIELYDGLQEECFDGEPENPKLIEMQRIIVDILGNDENTRGIVFVKTRQLVQALITWMNETEELSKLNAEDFVGQNAPAFKGGSTKSRQTDAMDYFKDGRHKILVATSVLEEGLDITKCNLVIRYEHVTNEIVRLQSRGRARAADSRYFVLTEAGSWIVAKEEKNRELEILMNKLVPRLQIVIEDHPNIWEQEILNIQTEMKEKEREERLRKEARMTGEIISIQCLNCQTEICKSTDIKLIQNVHHAIIGMEAAEKFLFLESPYPKFEDEELQYHGSIFCVKCFYTLGGICQYKHALFPLLKIGCWRDENGKTYKKWKDVRFRMESFTLDDLRKVVEERMEPFDL